MKSPECIKCININALNLIPSKKGNRSWKRETREELRSKTDERKMIKKCLHNS